MTAPDPVPAPARFGGYGRPRYTQTPNLFLEEQMQDLSLREMRTLLYIFRRTFGFQQDGTPIPLGDFLHGRRAKDGQRVDRGAGLAEHSLLSALKDLETKGFIFRHAQVHPAAGTQATYYELNIDGQPHCTPLCRPACPALADPSRKTDGTPSRKTDGTPSRKTDGSLSIGERKSRKERDQREGGAPSLPVSTPVDDFGVDESAVAWWRETAQAAGLDPAAVDLAGELAAWRDQIVSGAWPAPRSAPAAAASWRKWMRRAVSHALTQPTRLPEPPKGVLTYATATPDPARDRLTAKLARIAADIARDAGGGGSQGDA